MERQEDKRDPYRDPKTSEKEYRPAGIIPGTEPVGIGVTETRTTHETGETGGGLTPTSSYDEGRFIGYEVVDRDENKVGTIESAWLDETGDPAYLSVRTGWLGLGRSHIVPAQNVHLSEERGHLKVPYTLDQIKEAPEFDTNAELQPEDEERICSHYGRYGFRREGWLEHRPAAERTERPPVIEGRERTTETTGEQRMKLKEEEVRVGKREVEAGGVRLRKVVRTETVNQPVELKREDIVIERTPGKGGRTSEQFGEQEIYVPLRREEAVVSKEARVREEVRVGKREDREKQNVSETVRKEDVQVEREGESRLTPKGERGKAPRYEPKERSR
jgi:uncharacterized protein (TIGR02271 family)